jgi:hypothetical protein
MTPRLSACAAALALCVLASSPAAQTVYPTGTTIHDPDRTWNGFTVLSPLGTPAVLVIDMNGTVAKRWEDFNNSAGGPARVGAGANPSNAVYRAYRVPYDWIPQSKRPSEQRVTPPSLGEFKVASGDQKTR